MDEYQDVNPVQQEVFELLAPGTYVRFVATIDKRLVLGSTMFGVGWGLAGFCPGTGISWCHT